MFFENKKIFKNYFEERIRTLYAKNIDEATEFEKYTTLATMVQYQINRRWAKSTTCYSEKDVKQVYYLSMEFLPGKFLESILLKLGIKDLCEQAFSEMGFNLKDIIMHEKGPSVGNGGLGRLGACFMDSMATLGLPGHGCGIRYRYGFFEQKIIDGYQVELPDNWLKEGNVWEVKKASKMVQVRFGGTVKQEDLGGEIVYIHQDYELVSAIPYDLPLVGYQNKAVNTLRLWSAEAEQSVFDYQAFNRGEHQKAVEYRNSVEAISQVLYPDDNNYQNLLLRLKQQYFLVSASIQSIIRRYKVKGGDINDLDAKVAIHINDTHPVLAIPELMRILVDVEGLDWDVAWQITTNTISYTNHTTLPEALEKWSAEMFEPILPRIYMIVEEINKRFCQQLLRKYPEDWARIKDMAIIADGQVKMANLALVGSHNVNGVAKIHTEILKKYVLKNFYDIYPDKFINITNGIAHRRFLYKANPELAALITDVIGDKWIFNPEELIHLHQYASDASFQDKLQVVKQQDKERLAQFIKEKNDLVVDVNSIFDIQVKRIHAYKRQILNILHIIDLYTRLRRDPDLDITPRTFIFAGKAAPSYYLAKQKIKLINTLAAIINNDKTIKNKLKIVFLANYGVTYAEIIIPAGDVSEQISVAGKEASGTGNMKFMMNGAITLGTLDGANIEIKDAVGLDNIFIFGLTFQEVKKYYQSGAYNPRDIYKADPRIKDVVDQLVNGFVPAGSNSFTSMHGYGLDGEFNNIQRHLLYSDEYFVLKDFAAYVDAQERVDKTYQQRRKWLEMSAHNIAHSGKFSADRSVQEYATKIWGISPEKVL
ncbi:MAG: glycogen/starch/alpha-glucan phosphorylase [Desulfotomaculum sp.]|nr:glycogen/starch/alpha-glucan phosphorylase [Desulfotomaculum sp.]